MRSRRLSNQFGRGKREAELLATTLVEVDGNQPNAEIDETLPIEVQLYFNITFGFKF